MAADDKATCEAESRPIGSGGTTQSSLFPALSPSLALDILMVFVAGFPTTTTSNNLSQSLNACARERQRAKGVEWGSVSLVDSVRVETKANRHRPAALSHDGGGDEEEVVTT